MRSLSPPRAAMNAALDEAEQAFLAALPASLDLGDGWWAVHAGCVPRVAFAKQKRAVMLRCRWLDERGSMVGQPDPPPGASHWSDAWSGPERIVYGHHVHDLASPKQTELTAGIDTGCCFGGRLTALVLPDREVVQVAARQTYASLAMAMKEDE
jgi:diadenosine tetraphosphatase ApaH/serine/threonine PP2A family protein phosphatase